MSENPIDNLFDGVGFAMARMREERRICTALLPKQPPPSRIERVRRKIRRVRYETRDRLQHAWGALKGERCEW